MLEGSHCFVGFILLVLSRIPEQGRSWSCIDGVGHVCEHEAAGSLQGSLTRQQHLQGSRRAESQHGCLGSGLCLGTGCTLGTVFTPSRGGCLANKALTRL